MPRIRGSPHEGLRARDWWLSFVYCQAALSFPRDSPHDRSSFQLSPSHNVSTLHSGKLGINGVSNARFEPKTYESAVIKVDGQCRVVFIVHESYLANHFTSQGRVLNALASRFHGLILFQTFLLQPNRSRNPSRMGDISARSRDSFPTSPSTPMEEFCHATNGQLAVAEFPRSEHFDVQAVKRD